MNPRRATVPLKNWASTTTSCKGKRLQAHHVATVSSKIVERALPKFWKHDLVLHHHCCKSLKATAVDHTSRNENTWGKAYEVRRAEAEDPPRRHTIMEDKIPSEQRASRHGVAPSAEGSNGAKSSLFGTSTWQSFENISGATRSHRPNFCPPP
jgi:hypothetical protein